MSSLANPMGGLAGSDDLAVVQAEEDLPPLLLLGGQSNATPYRQWAESDLGLKLSDTFDDCYITQWVGDSPPSWTFEIARRTLRPIQVGNPDMGAELSLGRLLARRTGTTVELMQWARSGEPLATFTNATYLAELIEDIEAVQAASGTRLRAVLWMQGETDAMDSGDAAAYQTAFEDNFVAPLRAEFGDDLVFIVGRLNAAAVADHLSTLRAAQEAFVAGDDHAALVDFDDLPMLDEFHYRSPELTTIGNRLASAALDELGYGPQEVTGSTVVCLGSDTGVYGTGALVVRSLPDLVDGDLELLVVSQSYASGGISIADLEGFTLLQSDDSVASGTVHAYGAIYWRQVTTAELNANGGRMPSIVIADTNDKNAAKIYAFRSPNGTVTVGASAKSKNNALDTPMSCPGLTTTVDNALVFNVVTGWAGTPTRTLSSLTNASLASLAELQHSVFNVAGEGVVLSAYAGVKASAGVVSATTGTWSLYVLQTNFTVELQP